MSFPQPQPTPPNRGLLTFVLASVAGVLVAMVLLSRCSGTVTYSTAAEHQAEVARDNVEITKRCAGVTEANWFSSEFAPSDPSSVCQQMMQKNSMHLSQGLRPCTFGGLPAVCWSPNSPGNDLYISLFGQAPGIYLMQESDVARAKAHLTYP